MTTSIGPINATNIRHAYTHEVELGGSGLLIGISGGNCGWEGKEAGKTAALAELMRKTR